jgi:hypothetical protein
MIHSFISYTVPTTVTVRDSPPSYNAAAKNIPGALGNFASIIIAKAELAAAQTTTTTTKTVYVTQPCITTSGETFAIWLNVLYLAPLTYLFVNFFVRSYLRRTNAEAARPKGKTRRLSNVALDVAIRAEKASWDATKATQREVYGEGDESPVDGRNGSAVQ